MTTTAIDHHDIRRARKRYRSLARANRELRAADLGTRLQTWEEVVMLERILMKPLEEQHHDAFHGTYVSCFCDYCSADDPNDYSVVLFIPVQETP